MKQMYKVIFSYRQDSPSGGNSVLTGWAKEIKLYDAENAEELQKQIDIFLNVDIGDIFQLSISLSYNSNQNNNEQRRSYTSNGRG